LLIVGALMPRISGPLELSLFRSSFKTNLDAMLPEALLLARDVAVEVQSPDDPKKEEKAEEAIQRMLRLYNLRLYNPDRAEIDRMNRLIWSEYAKLRDRAPLQGRPTDRPEPEHSNDNEANS
jgi:hypothetical protein